MSRRRTKRARTPAAKPAPLRTGPTRPVGTGGEKGSAPVTPEVNRVVTDQDAAALAARLNSPTRPVPVVVVSTAAGQAEPYVDVKEIAEAVAGLAQVYVLPPGDASWAFSRGMAPQTQVYGGASRVYPADLSWTTRPTLAPLRFAYGFGDRSRVTDLLIADAMAAAMKAGLLSSTAGTTGLPAHGTVLGVVGNRALVSLDGVPATVWPELTVPGLVAKQLFSVGMHVSGQYEQREGRLDVRDSLVPLVGLIAGYEEGMTILGRIDRLDAGGCHVELVPGWRVFVAAGDVTIDTSLPLTSLITTAEVVIARIKRIGEPSGKGWRLSLVESDADERAPHAPALLPGGPPWLTVPDPVAGEPEEPEVQPPLREATEAPRQDRAKGSHRAADSELAGAVAQLEAMRQERDDFLSELSETRARLDRIDRDRVRLRAQVREAGNLAERRRREIADLEQRLRLIAQDGALFLDPVEQLDFEVRLAWARRTAPSEKRDLPLAPYRYGAEFLDTVAEVDGLDRQKFVDVIVDVATGRVHAVNGRETHQLRQAQGAGSTYVTRPDGSTCWRVALQVASPQARRLHYWHCPDGSLEFSSVRLHDDVKP